MRNRSCAVIRQAPQPAFLALMLPSGPRSSPREIPNPRTLRLENRQPAKLGGTSERYENCQKSD